VINLGGGVEAQCPGVGSGAKAALVVLATGTGLSPARGAVRAAASGTDRMGGAATGLPGNAACNVGFTAGCGTIEHLSTAEFQSRIESEVRKWERDYDENLVDQLFRLEGRVRQCVRCGWIDRTPDSTCPVLRQSALACRLAGRLASARQALQSSTGSDCRGRRRKAKQGRRNRSLAEVKGETKKRQFVQIPQRSKNLHITTTFEGHVSTGPRRHSWNRLRDWAEINPVSVCDQKKVGGRDRDRTGDPLLAKLIRKHDLVLSFSLVLHGDARFWL